MDRNQRLADILRGDNVRLPDPPERGRRLARILTAGEPDRDGFTDPLGNVAYSPSAGASMVQGEWRPYAPTWRDRIASWLIGDERPSAVKREFVEGLMGSTGLGTTGMGLVDIMPGGQVLAAQEAAREGDAQRFALAMTPVPGAANARRVGRAGKALPMDEASRMARAREMGFLTDIPVYHGTAREFSELSLEAPARNSQGPLARAGVSTTRDPGYASGFAELSFQNGIGSSPQVLPLLHRTEKPVRIDATDADPRAIAGAVQDAWDLGYDAVMIENYTMGAFKEGAPTTHIIVKDPAQLRSRFARFDPAKRDSRDLLAGVAGTGVLGAGMYDVLRERE
jgi:hypothetical protein